MRAATTTQAGPKTCASSRRSRRPSGRRDSHKRWTDARGPVITSITDANSKVTTIRYNTNGTVQDKTDPAGSCTATPKTHCTSYSYTYATSAPLVLQQVVTTPGQATSSLLAVTDVYDAAGRRTSSTVSGGAGTTRYQYDSRDRIISVYTMGDTTCVTADCVTYSYDDDGNLTQRGDSSGTTTWTWDKKGQVRTKNTGTTPCSVTLPDGTGLSGTSCADYDPAGNVITYKDSGGNVAYSYDSANQVTAVAEPGGSTTCSLTLNPTTKTTASKCTAFAYDANGYRTGELFPSGELVTTTPDVSGRVGSISAFRPTGSTAFLSRTYGYVNGAGNDVSLVRTVTDQATAVTTYDYDALNRLCWTASATSSSFACGTPPTGATTFSYDDAGNRKSMTSGGTTTQYQPNDGNELCWTASTTGSCGATPSGGTTYTYDVRGNLTGTTISGVAKFAGIYNGKEQATSLTAAGGGTATTFAYADLGNGERTSSTTSGTTTTFVNGLLGVSAQTVGAGPTQYFTRDPNGGLISMRSGSGSSGTSYYYIRDRLGSVISLTDSAGTTDVATYAYDSYGQTTSATGSQATVNPWRFAGGYYDGNTALTKFGARYYDAQAGRWLQADPSRSDPNAFAYSGNSPTNFVDPSGKAFWDATVHVCLTLCLDLGYSKNLNDAKPGHLHLGLSFGPDEGITADATINSGHPARGWGGYGSCVAAAGGGIEGQVGVGHSGANVGGGAPSVSAADVPWGTGLRGKTSNQLSSEVFTADITGCNATSELPLRHLRYR